MKSLWLVCLVVFSVLVTGPVAQADAPTNLHLGGYLQSDYANFGDGSKSSGFDLLRAELQLSGVVTPKVRFFLAGDVAHGYVTKDCYLVFTAQPNLEITAGQFCLPFGFELPQSDRLRETASSAYFARTLFSAKRDRGVMLTYHSSPVTTLKLAAVNGAGDNRADDDGHTDFVGRLEFVPSAKIHLGVSDYSGRKTLAGQRFSRNRIGADVQLFLAGVELRGEYLRADDLGVHPTGYLGEVIVPVGAANRVYLKYDVYDSDLGSLALAGNAVHTTAVGLLHQFDRSLLGKLSYEDTNAALLNPGSARVFRAELQVSF